MNPTVSNISRKIQKFEKISSDISLDINELLDSSNLVKKHLEVLIKLGIEINESTITHISQIANYNTKQECAYQNIASLMLILAEKSGEFHNALAKQSFFRVSLKSTLKDFENVISEMQELADDINSCLNLKHDNEWASFISDLDHKLSKG